MILDGLLTFTNLTGGGTGSGDSPTATGANSSTNQLDLHMAGLPVLASGVGARDIGIGDDPSMKLLVLVTAAFTTGGGGTLRVDFQGATDNGSGSPAAFSTYFSSPVYAVANLAAGTRLMDMDVPRPPSGVAMPRFLQLNYQIATAVMTAGTLKAFIVLDRHDLAYQSTNNAVLGGYPPGIAIAN
jgi:hypothetical protein